MVCIIATNVAPRELIVATEQVDLLRHGRPFVFTTESLGCNDGENPRMAPTSQLPPKFPLRPSSANRFPDRIVFLSRDDRFLSRDRENNREFRENGPNDGVLTHCVASKFNRLWRKFPNSQNREFFPLNREISGQFHPVQGNPPGLTRRERYSLAASVAHRVFPERPRSLLSPRFPSCSGAPPPSPAPTERGYARRHQG